MAYDKPTYDSSRTREPVRVREILRVAASLEKTDEAREIVLEWLENAADTDLPEQAFKGEAFRHEADGRSFAAARATSDDGDTWALRYVEPEEDGVSREWTTEIALWEVPNAEPQFSLRSVVKSAELKLRIQPTVPRFMEELAADCGLEQGAAKIEKEPWVVESDYDAANLAEFLVDPERRTPAFVLTVPEEAEDPNEPLLDAVSLASDTLGIAKVIVLPAEYTWKLTNRFGKHLSVYRGALRVYLPGFSEDADPEGGHDLFMPHRMDTPETSARLGALLRWIAARESLRRMRIGRDVKVFGSVLVPAIEMEGAKLAAGKASAKAQLEAAQRNMALLQAELELSMELQQCLTEENKALESRLREAESRLRSSQNRGRPRPDRFRDRPPRPRSQQYGRDNDSGRGRPWGRGDDRRSRGWDREEPERRGRGWDGGERRSRGWDRDDNRRSRGYEQEENDRRSQNWREQEGDDHSSDWDQD